MNQKINSASTVAEQKQQIHDCLRKLVEIKLTLQSIADPDQPKKNIWYSNDVGGLWCDLRTNIAAIYIDFLEMEVSVLEEIQRGKEVIHVQ